MWCVNRNVDDYVSSCLEGTVKKDNLKFLYICHNHICQAQKVCSLIALSLARRVHYNFRCKQIIDDLHTLGIYVRYKFITFYHV